MTSRTIRRAGADDDPAVAALATAAPFAPLRYLSLFGHDVAGPVLATSVARVGRDGHHLLVDDSSGIRASLGVLPVPYLSDHFGVPIVHLGPALTRPDEDRGARSELIADLLRGVTAEAAGADGVPTLQILRVEADDNAALDAATAEGFRLYETTLTWVNDLERVHLNPPRTDWPDIEVLRLGIDPPPSEEVLAGLRGGGALIGGDHYHNDPRLDPGRAGALYERWLERGLVGDGSDVAVLRFHEGALIGIGLWTRWRDLEPFGIAMLGNGFGFRAAWAPPGTTQDFSAIVCNRSLLDNRLLEWSTQSTNMPMANMISREPSIRLCRTSHVLHRWSDEA